MPDWLSRITEAAYEGLISEGALTETARSYLQRRGVSEADIREYRIGFTAPPFAVKECSKDFHDWSRTFLHEKLVFPLYAPSGEVIGIQVRSIVDPESGPRYQQFYCYPQEIYPYLFGLPQALPRIYETERVVLVEGIFDYFAVKNYAPNSLSMLTAGVPAAVKRFLQRYCKQVLMLTDMDTVGREAAERLHRDLPNLIVLAPSYTEKDPAKLAEAKKMYELMPALSWYAPSRNYLSLE